ncbi:ATP-binding protein [Bradyrhizobium sp. Arg816]|uniref:ATP-binding protein n=1 Tax=Bradyrhizobium sp. Arg816 TaxID=2998491 RepID=UPI00249DD517|nr:ATP-binding protein [Bradyrhizobium sp. Arg816]MDI3562886.1 ATP-binding protein [Bradyrhizobium sp. Arg816]
MSTIRSTAAAVSKISQDASVIQTDPSAGRIAHAIAAFPYDPLTATMDIVDNSVENGASGVSVSFAKKGKTIEQIVIADNGSGIADAIIDEVLRAGSRTEHLYRSTSLSRFGVGLKGAGFALATNIEILTRSETGVIQRRSIDQGRIERTDRWEQEARAPTAEERKFFEVALAALPGPTTKSGGKGTVVVLRAVKLQTRDLTKLRSNLVRKAGETYGKILSATADSIRRLSINIDDIPVEPFDPLHRENPDTQSIYRREKIDFDDGTSAFFTAIALPHPNSQPEELVRRYRYNQKHQGAYVYRNGRLVRSGETFGLFSRDFHLNAFRAEIEFDSSADTHFKVDVAKSTIVLDDEAEAKFKDLFRDSARTADALWRQKDVPTKVEIDDLFNESNRLIGSRANLLIEAVNQKKGELRVPRRGPVVAPPKPTQPIVVDDPALEADVPASDQPSEQTPPPAVKRGFAPYLRAVDSLPDGVLYRPLMDGEVGGLVVEVNISHPFAKTVFEAAGIESGAGNGKRAVPRRATTAIQQLLYVLGYCEYTMSGDDDDETGRLFEQYRRYLSMNVTALLD